MLVYVYMGVCIYACMFLFFYVCICGRCSGVCLCVDGCVWVDARACIFVCVEARG